MKKFILSILVALFTFSSCTDFFEATPNNMLVNEEHYTSKSNVYSAFAGLLTCIQNVAAKHIIISELRSDVLTPTSKAPDEYWDIFNFEAGTGNSLVDPTPYYNIVVNANDFLCKAVEYNTAYPGHMDETVYSQLIAAAVNIRAWAYLQIGKVYGEAAYYDYTMSNMEVDLSTIPVLSFDELINELLYFIEEGVDGISGWSSLDLETIFDVSGECWNLLGIAPDALKLELYLWQGNYAMAAMTGLKIITGQSIHTDSYVYKYTLNSYHSNDSWDKFFYQVPASNDDLSYEALSFVMFETQQRQENEIHYLCSNTPPNVYYMTITDSYFDRFDRSMAYGEEDEFGKDVGRRRDDYRAYNITYGYELSERVFMKYHCNSRTYYDRDAAIYLYRASEIHLMICEALVGLGNFDAASVLLNEGPSSVWTSGAIYAYPLDAPIYGYSKLQGGLGVRGRVNAAAIDYEDEDYYYGVDTSDSLTLATRQAFVLDSLIASETALELGGEGKRWFTLLRIARNTNNPSFLIDEIASKFPEETQNRYKILLQDQSKWFIDYDLGVSYTDSYSTESTTDITSLIDEM